MEIDYSIGTLQDRTKSNRGSERVFELKLKAVWDDVIEILYYCGRIPTFIVGTLLSEG